MSDRDYASVRYIVDDVAATFEFYTTHLGFTELNNFAPELFQPAARPAS
jgi:catechol 2,3-dioxygenase-like lactoylglutathione lyase family enzyme